MDYKSVILRSIQVKQVTERQPISPMAVKTRLLSIEGAVSTEQSEVPSLGALVVLFDQHPEPPQFQADTGYDTKCRSRWRLTPCGVYRVNKPEGTGGVVDVRIAGPHCSVLFLVDPPPFGKNCAGHPRVLGLRRREQKRVNHYPHERGTDQPPVATIESVDDDGTRRDARPTALCIRMTGPESVFVRLGDVEDHTRYFIDNTNSLVPTPNPWSTTCCIRALYLARSCLTYSLSIRISVTDTKVVVSTRTALFSPNEF